MKKVFIYCRKSSESEDRQALSIEAQLDELYKLKERLKLQIVGTYTESKSAKAPGRIQFTEMMTRIMSGEADGILCWKLNRLARNPIDGGSVIWATKERGIEIFTPGSTYDHEGMLLMYVEFGMAQKFVDDLSKDSQRGMLKKAKKGWYPAPAPIGYKNTPDRKKGFKIIVKDEESFALVRRSFELVISGTQAINAWAVARNEWRLTGKTGNLISRSAFYFMLTNPFYFGEYEWPKKSGNWFKGKHEAIITRDEFDLVQNMLGKHGKPIARTHEFDLTGLIRCAECGCAITGTRKTKYYKKTNRTAVYCYYHCTKKKRGVTCSQKPLTEDELNEQIDQLLHKIKLKAEFVEWARRWLKVVHNRETLFQENTLKQRQEILLKIENRLNKLVDMRLDEQIGEKQYNEKKKQLESELKATKDSLEESTNSLETWRDKVDSAFDFANSAYDKFHNGTREEKHEILIRIGANLTLYNKKVRIDLKKYFEIFSEQENWQSKYSDRLEPQKYADIYEKRPLLRPSIPVWLPG